MGEPLITTELENAILRMHYMPTDEWAVPVPDVVAHERELNRAASLRVLDVLCDVSREFMHINLGLNFEQEVAPDDLRT